MTNAVQRQRIQPALTERQLAMLEAIQQRKGWNKSVAVGEAVELLAKELGLTEPVGRAP